MDGLLLVSKPEDYTSFKVVSIIKRKFGLKKVGHAGTLDPFATGLLVILINKATKLSSRFLEADKSYTGTIVLGKQTDTYDIEGKVIEQNPASHITKGEVKKVFKIFTDRTKQKPPLFSAIKLKGQKAYKVARKGGHLDLPEREITIYELVLLDFKAGDNPKIIFGTTVSKGTYIRSLAHDVGKELGTGAYLQTLVRQTVGKFSLDSAYSLDDILKWNSKDLEAHLIKA